MAVRTFGHIRTLGHIDMLIYLYQMLIHHPFIFCSQFMLGRPTVDPEPIQGMLDRRWECTLSEGTLNQN